MIRRVLLFLGAFGVLWLLAAAAAAYGWIGHADPQQHAHVLLSLAATLILLFAHTWIVLYLVATGRVMVAAVTARGLDAALLERARRLRLRALPWLLGAVISLVATFLLGGVAVGGSVLRWLHHGFFFLTLVMQVAAFRVEAQVLAEHDVLSIDVARRLEADAA